MLGAKGLTTALMRRYGAVSGFTLLQGDHTNVRKNVNKKYMTVGGGVGFQPKTGMSKMMIRIIFLSEIH